MFLALDAGGTSTRAVTLDASGHALGYGRAATGNPTAVGIESAVAAIGHSAQSALAGEVATDPVSCVIAMAGQQTPAFLNRVSARLGSLGVGPVLLQPDLLGIFHSGTHELDGYALVAGTGSVAARIRDGRLERVVGGRGWLLGDEGSGFWIGHHVARAVVAALDNQVPPTALTDLVLAAVGIEAPGSPIDRDRALHQLLTALWARRPVELSAFATLAFQSHADPAARAILLTASRALAQLITAVRMPDQPGPLVVGGSVAVRGMLAAPHDLRGELTRAAAGVQVIPVPDGVVGAAVLALRSAEIHVDAALFDTLRAEVGRVAASAA